MSVAFQVIAQRSALASYQPGAGSPAAILRTDLLAPLERLATSMTAERNQEIFAEGEPAKYCYQVVSGCVRTVKLMEDGRRQVDEFLLPGDFFALEVLGEYNFSAEAVTPVRLRRYTCAALEEFADRDRDFARRLWRLTAGQLRAARERMVLLGRKTASERIASFLLDMAERVSTDGGERIDLPMSRGDMADHLGLTIETVCRGLTQLRRHGTIAIDRGQIAILDARALGSAGGRVLH
jgi:CRP/FNR family nitrogen fixation transcriptional regulator